LGHRGAEQALGAGLRPDLAIDVTLFFPALVMRYDLVRQEPADRVAEHRVRFGKEGAFDHGKLRAGFVRCERIGERDATEVRQARCSSQVGPSAARKTVATTMNPSWKAR